MAFSAKNLAAEYLRWEFFMNARFRCNLARWVGFTIMYSDVSTEYKVYDLRRGCDIIK